MNRPRYSAIAVSLFAVLLTPRGNAQQTTSAALPTIVLPPPLARVLTDYENAWSRRDAAALASLFADDGFVLSGGVPPVRGRAAIQTHYAGAGGPLALRALAYATDGSIGYIIGAFAPRKGEPDAGKFTLTLRKDASGRWLIVSDMDNANARPGPRPAQGSGGVEPLPRALPQSVGLSTTVLAKATELLRQFVADRKIAGAVAAVSRNGKVVYLEPVGVQDVETRAPMEVRSIFRIYSMTKSVTAVAAMMLQEEGRFSLSDPVSKYLPEFDRVTVFETPDGPTRRPVRAMTVEDLLLHTSGLSHRTSDLYKRREVRSRAIALPAFVDNIVRVPLMEDPHTRFRYSEATTVVGRLVEVWSGKPLDVFLDERVFRPLRMADTGFWIRPDQRARLASVYAPAAAGLAPIEIESVPFTERPALLEGAVGLVSTVPDYLRFAQMLLNRGELDGVRVLKASTVDAMVANGLPESILRARGGTGWGLANVNVAADGEYGWDGTAGTIFWVDPKTQIITILMTQIAPANPDNLRQRFKTLVEQAIVP
jgi:CubicO group peptidase (beta-lactamase class C family)/ketosteroid isomerase-like protein